MFFSILLLLYRFVVDTVKWSREMIWAVRENSSELIAIWEVLSRLVHKVWATSANITAIINLENSTQMMQ
jgi:hypothetical protein